MVFSSPSFLFLFLPIVFLVNLLLRRSIRLSNAWLLIVSLVFYAWGEPLYVLLMIVTTFFNYLAARFIGRGKRRGRVAVTLGIVWNIGSLVLFKYTDFLIASFNSVFQTSIPLLNIALPIGISFFTFQAMSYLIDVYRGDAEMNRSYFDILLYISLFPQLIAGPIVKYHDVALQIHSRSITIKNSAMGFRRFCFGLAKKVLLANTLATLADQVFALENAALGAPIAWLGALCYLMQIYFDFSGYSDMALGLGRAFGFTFLENFNYPYTAQSMQDFWRRWHISLSTWFKLYVYIPLGGNRKGKLRTGVNKMLVFLLTGLWHGASWSFALWGIFHGAFLMLEAYGVLKPNKWHVFFRRAYVLLAVTIGFVLFRSESLSQAGAMLWNMFLGFSISIEQLALFLSLLSPIALFTLIVSVPAATPIAHKLGEGIERGRYRFCIFAIAGVLLLLCMFNLASSAYNPFIYFRF